MRKTIKLLLLLVMAIVCQGAWADDDYFIGSNEYAPYKVGSAEDLIELSIRMKRHKDAYYVMCYVVLTNDIDMSAYPDWTPIGYDEDEANRMGFNGTFNGMGHAIYNLKSQSGNVGLFWKLWGADIRNVNFRNVDLKGAKGSVVCTETVDATIENVNVMSGSISINQSASGICVNADMIKRCENHANVTSPNTAAGISVNAKNVVECINYGDVSASAAAGISTSPNTTSEVQDCANYGTIDGTIAVGITLFSATGKLVNCLNSGRIKHTENPETPGSRDDKCSLLAYSDLAMELWGNNMYVAPQDNGSDSFNPVNSRTSIVGEALEISNEEISNGFAAYYLQKYHQDNDEVPVWVWGQNLAKEGSHPILVKGNPNLDNPRVFGHVTMRCDKTVSGEFSNEVSFGDSFMQMVNHSPEHVAIDHDCAIGGTQEHWVCQVCHKIFKDEKCTEETSLDELTIPAGHDFAGGVCKYCEYDIRIAEGDYTISVSATGKDFDYEKIECFDYIRCFVPNRNGILQISLTGGGDVDKVVEIFKKTGDSYPYVNVRIDNPIYLTANVEEGVAYYIGIRASENNEAIDDASLSLKLVCSEHKIEYVAEKEPTCTEHGHGQFLYCSACGKYFDYYTGYETDWKSYDWGLAEHKLVDGVCQECDYHVPTLELAKDADGNFTYSADNVEFDRRGVYWGESHSIFRVFIPEHGKLDVKAYVDVTSGDYQPVKVKSAHEFEYHESYPSGGGVQSAPQRRKAPEVYVPEQNTQVPGGYVYILVNNQEEVTSKLEVTLYSHIANVHVETEGKPATCTEDGTKTVYYCDHEDCTFVISDRWGTETIYYYFTEDGIGNPDDRDIIIPATGHQFDEDGQCSVCGMEEPLGPEFEGTLELAREERGNVTENDFVETVMNYFPTPEDFSMVFVAKGGVTYKRNSTTSRWGTVILPYELKSNDDVTYYRLSQVGEAAEGETAVMTFSPVETVAPNTPTVYRFNKEASSYQYDASTTSQTLVTLPEYTTWIETQVDGLPEWTMCGFYEQHIINSNDNIQNYRYISKDKFMTASNTLTVNPYRAVFRVGRAASAKTFVIAIADGGTTSIQAVANANGVEEVIGIYDINGRQLNTMQRGVNIIRTADGKTHKIINK